MSADHRSAPGGRGWGAEQGPPRLALALLRQWLPDGVLGLSILGDLLEEYGELSDRTPLGRDLWFWRASLSLGVRYGLRRMGAAIRDMRGGEGLMTSLSTLWADLRFGVRMLWKSPLLSGVAVLTIAMGVGLTTHTFSTVYGSVLRGVPVPEDGRLVHIAANRPELGFSQMEIPIHDFHDLQQMQTSFDELAAFSQGNVNVAGEEAPPERYQGAYASANFFEVIEVPPALGRTFRPEDGEADAPSVIVLGHHVWQNRFAGDPGILGRMIRVNGEPTEVIGVMPAGFRFPFLEDVWLPHGIDPDLLDRGMGTDFDVFGRLSSDVTMDVANQELTRIATILAETYPDVNAGIGMYAVPYEERFMPPEITAILWVMLVATFGVLMIACTNVANLLMARATIRSKEIAVRSALGAGRWRVIRQLLMESVVLATAGGIAGVALAAWGVSVYRGITADIYKPYWIDFRMDIPVLLFSLAVSGLAAILAGTLPAIRASGASVGAGLKDESRGSSSLRLGRLSRALVVSEIAVSCALLIAAGFAIRSVVNLNNVELGFESEGVLTGRVALFENDYPTEEERDQFFTQLRERLAQEPGVRSATITSALPGLGGPQYFFGVEGGVYPTDDDYPFARTNVVSPGFFQTFGVPLVAGRVFDEVDTQSESDPVAVVNESFAETYLPGLEPIGARLRLGNSGSTRPWRRIVGVVPDMHVGGNVGGIGDDRERPERIFVPQGALDLYGASFAVRTELDPVAQGATMRALVSEIDPNLPVYEILPLDQAIEAATWAFGMFGSLFSIVGLSALFLASVGLYGVMAFSVSQRRREMGVRLALGAEPTMLVRMVLAGGARQLAVGMVIGVGLGVALSSSMQVILYGVDATDPVVYGSIVLALTVTGLLACLLPARSATRADPVRVMRGE